MFDYETISTSEKVQLLNVVDDESYQIVIGENDKLVCQDEVQASFTKTINKPLFILHKSASLKCSDDEPNELRNGDTVMIQIVKPFGKDVAGEFNTVSVGIEDDERFLSITRNSVGSFFVIESRDPEGTPILTGTKFKLRYPDPKLGFVFSRPKHTIGYVVQPKPGNKLTLGISECPLTTGTTFVFEKQKPVPGRFEGLYAVIMLLLTLSCLFHIEFFSNLIMQ